MCIMDLSLNEENLTQILNKLSEDEVKIEKNLENILSRQCHVEAKLQNISKVLPNVVVIRTEGEKFCNMITRTNELAENVSAKVRQLDLARSRVYECQRRVNDILDLQLCSEGVAMALRNEDYEQGAAHVHRYLSMDQQLLERTAEDILMDHTNISSSLITLQQAALQLRTVVTHKFDEAVKSEDLASVERFFKIFPLLGMHTEGLKKFCSYLCTKLQETAQKNLKAALEIKSNDKRASVIFSDTMTLLFEGIARIVEIHQPIIETYYGPGRLLMTISILQKECDRQVKKIIAEFMKHRYISKKVQIVNEHVRKPNSERANPKDFDLLLGEITIMHSRAELYIRFLKRRVKNDIEISTTNDVQYKDLITEFENIINNSDLAHGMQELLSAYLALERYFLEESVNKALGMDTLDQDQQTSSMVDDVFFIVQKCIRRSMSSWSIDGVCAVVNMACGILEGEFANRLRNRLRQGYPAGYLDLTQAYNALLPTSIQHGRLQTSDTELARLTFLAYLNNTDVSIEYVETLCKSLSPEIDATFPNMQSKDRGKIDSCLSGLKSVMSILRAVTDYGLEQLRISAVKPRVTPWVDAFLSVDHHINEDDLLRYETEEPFVQTLIMNLEGLLQSFKGSLTTSNYDALIGLLTAEVTARLEKVVLKSTFNRAGGLILDKEIRSLASYLAAVTSWSVRDKFARLTQIATILSVEKVEELADYCGADAIAWRLTPAEVRRIASMRIDFRPEDLKRLKL
ncbi:conserved oligomeric Golgi complex subunit 4 isoform X1 [Apis mellifera caucasica]|uniref:Conserved oligomeric Golgi complex subunit 4 n=3 Tax=Apis mellifera TaxID=7460 RepID=A0A7M7R6Y3_APIME|nr:conserved oligomeric Golgi complex subunit 4 isoform X1 [Apis mellifera]KAG6800682.1 conserved oligomeric Golgi complex subunit 4 isoform X1 [Apis mellifera caucasica]KAG9433634.1 conserved oligomeric Golgi complex subunit 4 isoform X1 [Apis mellifera carnica]|eukprot:XP_394599.3 conserved oligomeric Golgi complex subunit 4 isoform X1 [Apis mellifera]